MAKMTVHMLGIMYFHICHADDCDPTTRQVLLPDGTKGTGQIPPHFASIFVEEERYDDHHKWPGEIHRRKVTVPNLRGKLRDVKMLEFRITEPNTVITFPDGGSGKVNVVNLDQGLLPLRDIDPQFEPDLNGGGSIARVQVGGGTFEAFALNGVNPVQWTMESGKEPLKITATAGTKEGTIFVRPQRESALGAEIVFTNAPDLLSRVAGRISHSDHEHPGHDPASHDLASDSHGSNGHGSNGHGGEAHHFSLYGKINKGPSVDLQLPTYRMEMPNGHAYLKALGDIVIQSSCTGTCCAITPPGTI